MRASAAAFFRMKAGMIPQGSPVQNPVRPGVP